MRNLILLVCLLAALAIASSRAETIVALTSGNRVLFFDSTTPGTVTKTLQFVTNGGEPLVGMDCRPDFKDAPTGELYAIGASGRLYLLSLPSGAQVSPTGPPPTLVGSRFGIDFNPVADRIRLTSDAEQDIRINPDSNVVAGTDGALQFAPGDIHAGANPNVVGCAYTNNFKGAGATVLYDIDSNLDALLIQNPPNMGTLRTVGNLGLDTSDNVGFDISGATGIPYASLTVGGVTGLYQIDLITGAATLIGTIGNATSLAGETVVDIAVPTQTRLLNISTRGRVGLGDDVLIAGFINQGGGRVVLRAIGPSLGAFGVPSPLPDPVLTLRDHNGTVLRTNDDWRTDQEADITAAGLAPTSNLESAILVSLEGNNYTAIVTGKGSATGIALVEIFQIP